MSAFMRMLGECSQDFEGNDLCRDTLELVQVNIGNICNQQCTHCHVGASPAGTNLMQRDTMNEVVRFLKKAGIKTLDVTGGAPEMHPDFEYLLTHARSHVDEIIVRSNLTVLQEPGKENIIDVYKKMKLHLVCSLPCYLEENVDAQRGKKTFQKSIESLKRLNDAGYGTHSDYIMDLVYNPTGPLLPPKQLDLEMQYKKVLKETYGISFHNLITITNVPIKRFAHFLQAEGNYESYMELLKNNFNCATITKVMCRSFISVGYDGRVYDCDFNQALGWNLKDKNGNDLFIGSIEREDLEGMRIHTGDHCFACTAGSGSSCKGALN